MKAVGIDVSKGKSMVAAVDQNKTIIMPPQEYPHTQDGLQQIVTAILALDPHAKVVVEATGHYHEPIVTALSNAGIYTSLVNPMLVHAYGDNSIRRVKTDKKDAVKIARYCLDSWDELRQYTHQNDTRQQLKMFSRQYNLCIKTLCALENNLKALLDQTYPGLSKFFASQKKKNGHQKWVDFAIAFPHVGIVTAMSQQEFVTVYSCWCFQNAYRFTPAKAEEIYTKSQGLFATMHNNEDSRTLIISAATQVYLTAVTLAELKERLIRLATTLPEYPAVIAMYGAGELTAAQLIAEIGDVRRFHTGRALVAYAGIDPLPHQSGTYDKASTKTSKRGSAPLRKTLFQITVTHIRLSPQNEAVYQFLNRKREEGKPFYVYMTAAANKFLRIYYARVKAYLQCPSANFEC